MMTVPSPMVFAPNETPREAVTFGLEMQGDSMIDAGIHDGDMVLIRMTELADSGDIVLARVGEEAMLRRLRRKGLTMAFEADNPAYGTRICGPGLARIEGRVVGLIRRYPDREKMEMAG